MSFASPLGVMRDAGKAIDRARGLILLVGIAACSGRIAEDTPNPSYPVGAAPSGTVGVDAPPSGPLGVTPGGAKDIGLARTMIAMGAVPDGKTITVEGLLSEHDIPVEGPDCTSLLCARPALGVATALDTNQREHFIQLGFTSGFRASTFQRPPLDVVVLIDHSSAMSIDQGPTNAAVASLIEKMRDDDRLAILIFNDKVDTLFPLGRVTDKPALKASVKSVRAQGNWDFQPALERAYGVLGGVANDPRRLRRVMVFSCGYPMINPDMDDPASKLVQSGAATRIGLSFFGVLLGWDPNLADLLGRARGGAYYYLQDLAKIEQVFDSEFDLMVTPILYQLKIAIDPGANFEVVKLYGMPGMSADDPVPAMGPPVTKPGAAQGTTGGAFLSSRKGAIVARLRLKNGAVRGDAVGTVTLGYEPEPALGFGDQPVEEKVAVSDVSEAQWNDAEVFQGAGVRNSVVLTNQALRMRAACDAYHGGNKQQAVDIVTQLHDYLVAEAPAFGTDLDPEVELVARLLANVAN